MKKILSTVLAAAMLVGTFALGAMSVSAAALTAAENGDELNGRGSGCSAFIDSNIKFTEALDAESIADVKIEVNGKPAYWNQTYLGNTHCGIIDDSTKAWLGIVGADIKACEEKENTFKLTDKSGNTYETTFSSAVTVLGYSYAKAVVDVSKKSAKVEVIFNTDPGFAVGTTFSGRVHDEHDKDVAFKVTAYDKDTKMYTIESDAEFTTTHSVLELKVTSDGANKDAWFAASIVEKTGMFVGDKKITEEATKITITEATANRGNAANLLDGNSGTKLEGNAPSAEDPVTVEFKTATAVKPNYFVIYTGNDDATWSNRAPNAFTLYGVANGTETKLIEKTESGMLNYNYTPFAYEVNTDTAYDTFKLVITSRISLELEPGQQENGWFQFGGIELYTGSVKVSDSDRYGSVKGAVDYIGTAPTTADPTTPPTKEPEKDPTTPKPVPTGDVAVALSVAALVAVAGAVVIAKKRKIED